MIFRNLTNELRLEGEKIEQLSYEQFIQLFEISRAFFPYKTGGKKTAKFEYVVEIAPKADVFLSL